MTADDSLDQKMSDARALLTAVRAQDPERFPEFCARVIEGVFFGDAA